MYGGGSYGQNYYGGLFQELGGPITRSITDTLTITEDIVRIIPFVRVLQDTEGLTDSLSISFKVVTLSDTIGLSDTITSVRTISVSLTDGVTISDVLQQLYQEVGITSVKWQSVQELIPQIEAILDSTNNSNKINELDDFLPQIDSVDQL